MNSAEKATQRTRALPQRKRPVVTSSPGSQRVALKKKRNMSPHFSCLETKTRIACLFVFALFPLTSFHPPSISCPHHHPLLFSLARSHRCATRFSFLKILHLEITLQFVERSCVCLISVQCSLLGTRMLVSISASSSGVCFVVVLPSSVLRDRSTPRADSDSVSGEAVSSRFVVERTTALQSDTGCGDNLCT